MRLAFSLRPSLQRVLERDVDGDDSSDDMDVQQQLQAELSTLHLLADGDLSSALTTQRSSSPADADTAAEPADDGYEESRLRLRKALSSSYSTLRKSGMGDDEGEESDCELDPYEGTEGEQVEDGFDGLIDDARMRQWKDGLQQEMERLRAMAADSAHPAAARPLSASPPSPPSPPSPTPRHADDEVDLTEAAPVHVELLLSEPRLIEEMAEPASALCLPLAAAPESAQAEQSSLMGERDTERATAADSDRQQSEFRSAEEERQLERSQAERVKRQERRRVLQQLTRRKEEREATAREMRQRQLAVEAQQEAERVQREREEEEEEAQQQRLRRERGERRRRHFEEWEQAEEEKRRKEETEKERRARLECERVEREEEERRRAEKEAQRRDEEERRRRERREEERLRLEAHARRVQQEKERREREEKEEAERLECERVEEQKRVERDERRRDKEEAERRTLAQLELQRCAAREQWQLQVEQRRLAVEAQRKAEAEQREQQRLQREAQRRQEQLRREEQRAKEEQRRRDRAAVFIQRLWRGWRIRRGAPVQAWRAQRRADVEQQHQSREVSATNIQRVWRGWRLRRKLRRALDEAVDVGGEEEDQWDYAGVDCSAYEVQEMREDWTVDEEISVELEREARERRRKEREKAKAERRRPQPTAAAAHREEHKEQMSTPHTPSPLRPSRVSPSSVTLPSSYPATSHHPPPPSPPPLPAAPPPPPSSTSSSSALASAWGISDPRTLAALQKKRARLQRMAREKARVSLSPLQRLARLQEKVGVVGGGRRRVEEEEREWHESRVETEGRPGSGGESLSRFPPLVSPAHAGSGAAALAPSVARLVSRAHAPRVGVGGGGQRSAVPPAWLQCS